MLYLDNAATTARKPLAVYASMIYNTLFGGYNAGRSGSAKSLRAARTVIRAQEAVAELIGAEKPQNIIFTPNATFALNAVILGASRGGHIAVSEMDHNSVLRPAFRLGRCTAARADRGGYVSAAAFERAITPETTLAVCTHASNVCGTTEPAAQIAAAAHRAGALFLLDASQTIGSLKVDNREIDADFIAFAGHKGLMAPMGTGVLYVRDKDTIEPVITGGTGSMSESLSQPDIMPDMLHSGTLNIPAIAALDAAAKYVLRHRPEIEEREGCAAAEFERLLRQREDITIYGRSPKTAICAFNIEGLTSAETEERLSGRIALRSGYHCAPLAHKALGTWDTGAVRVSFGAFDSVRAARRAAEAVLRVRSG